MFKRLSAGLKVVYLLRDEQGLPRYVGVTNYPRSRYAAHLKSRGNSERSRWIRKLRARGHFPPMEVLEVTADWEEAEVRWIARFKALGAGLVNGTAGGLDMTHLPPEFVKKPWVAGRGIKSPSHFAFFGATGQLRSDESRYRWEHMKKALNRLSDAERCKFEIWAYGQFRPALRRKLNKWLDVAAPKMAKCLEESLNARA